ncbi:MAG: hypothetical protein D6797_03955 [Bdellovibrio sp.]|nr:MAG: hypothetical protein D6797_03955 [Bdellovibrio sp.]
MAIQYCKILVMVMIMASAALMKGLSLTALIALPRAAQETMPAQTTQKLTLTQTRHTVKHYQAITPAMARKIAALAEAALS